MLAPRAASLLPAATHGPAAGDDPRPPVLFRYSLLLIFLAKRRGRARGLFLEQGHRLLPEGKENPPRDRAAGQGLGGLQCWGDRGRRPGGPHLSGGE